jgi:hypothetical protein
MLSFAESYDPQWMATVYASGERLEGLNPIPLYELINGFWINQTGELDIMIEYVPQRWFFYGSIISLTTLIASVTYLTYSYTKKRAPVTPSKNEISLESASQDVRAILSARSLDTC